jgi:hypothetical protein
MKREPRIYRKDFLRVKVSFEYLNLNRPWLHLTCKP